MTIKLSISEITDNARECIEAYADAVSITPQEALNALIVRGWGRTCALKRWNKKTAIARASKRAAKPSKLKVVSAA